MQLFFSYFIAGLLAEIAAAGRFGRSYKYRVPKRWWCKGKGRLKGAAFSCWSTCRDGIGTLHRYNAAEKELKRCRSMIMPQGHKTSPIFKVVLFTLLLQPFQPVGNINQTGSAAGKNGCAQNGKKCFTVPAARRKKLLHSCHSLILEDCLNFVVMLVNSKETGKNTKVVQ